MALVLVTNPKSF